MKWLNLSLVISLLFISLQAFADKKPVVLAGIDVLEAQGFAPLQGKQVGLITNHTGVNLSGRSTADILAKAPNVKLVALFSPEHGIRGSTGHGELIGDGLDSKLFLPVYSLYGAVKKPTPQMLNAIDVLVFDMQDVGARFYTYLTTMGMAMEAAAERKISFVVLDRPNPIGGDVVEGQILDPRLQHFTAYYSIPTRHGLTAGELAKWYKDAKQLELSLNIIPLKNWSRDMQWPETQRGFLPPSPNIRNPTAALLYVGIGMFETTNVSVGRGTAFPFEQFGAPWIDGQILERRLTELRLPGLEFLATEFTPMSDLYQGRLCSGIRIKVIDPKRVRPIDLFVHVSCIIRELWLKDFQPRWDEVARVAGSQDFEHLFIQSEPAIQILEVFRKSAEEFNKARQEYLLY